MQSIRALIVEDSEDDAVLINRELKKGSFDLYSERVCTEAGLLDALNRVQWDIIISDYSMPGFGGTEVLRIVRESSFDIPVIIVSGVRGEEYAVETMRAGASDYLRKDALSRLSPAIRREVKEARNRAARRKAEEEARKTAEALRESEERFHQIFLQSQDAQIVLDVVACRVIDSNSSATGLLGFTREELLESGPSAFIETSDHSRFEDALYGARGGCSPSSRNFTIDKLDMLRKDGTAIVASISCQLVNLRQGEVAYCTLRDLTEKIRLDEDRKLMHAKLIHANKMTSIGTLASGVAHEINNPNNFILFNSNLLLDVWKDASSILEGYFREHGEFSIGGLSYSEASEALPELLNGITEGSRRIKEIVDNLRDFSRTAKAGVEGSLDVNRATKASVSMLSFQISKFTDNFHVICGENIPLIKGNEQKIEQVVMNLVMNAIQALSDRKKGVWVHTLYDANKGEVEIKVSDEGVGMREEMLERITEPFFTTKSDTGGTGLGLSISYSIIKEHGGSLEFSSRPGEGTTVIVKLPADSPPSRL